MPPLVPGPADYERALAAAGLGGITVFHRLTTLSTNDDAKAIVAARPKALEGGPAIVVAEDQTGGRGRGAKAWSSPPGSVAFTIAVQDVAPDKLGVLPLGVGASVACALRSLGAKAEVKWPNDVLIADRKVCGILCESSVGLQTARVFLGIGINVETLPADPEIAVCATSLAAQGVAADRPALVADITARVLALLQPGASNARTIEAWKAVAAPWWGEEVTLVEGGIETTARLLDVDGDGRLQVRSEEGGVRSLVSGEVRKLRIARA